jgi:L-lysine exporter family protein LysE/ArgO
MLIEYILSAILLGVIVAIPPGSVTVVAVQRALRFGFANSVFFSLGSALTDVFYLTLVWFGVAHVVADNRALKIGLWFVSGGLLIALGVASLVSLKKEKGDDDRAAGLQENRPATFISGILVTLTNPVTIVGWVAVAGNFFLTWGEKFPASRELGVLVIVFIMAGVLGWFLPFTFAVSRLRKKLKPGLKKALVLVTNLILMAFGALALYYAAATLLAGA